MYQRESLYNFVYVIILLLKQKKNFQQQDSGGEEKKVNSIIYNICVNVP